MSTNQPATRRRGEAARSEAIDAARSLLAEGGPSAVTLKAVGLRMGVGHANLIHHFGSAAGLQAALMDRVVRDLADSVASGLATMTPGDLGNRRLLDAVFEAFDRGGAAELAAMLVLARESERAAGLGEVVGDLADRVAVLAGGGEPARAKARSLVLIAAYMAFADALIGPMLRPMLHVSDTTPRDLAMLAAMSILTAPPPDQ